MSQRSIEKLAEAGRKVLADHVVTNVSSFVQALVEHGDAWAFRLMAGSGEDYVAFEVWEVSEWLGSEMRALGQRVVEMGGRHYWARGKFGGSLHEDEVFGQISMNVMMRAA